MGMTQVTVTVRNPAQPEKTWDGLFLVDTGAVDCLVPGKHLKAIGIQPRSKHTYELADGSEIKMDIATAEMNLSRLRRGLCFAASEIVVSSVGPSRSGVI